MFGRKDAEKATEAIAPYAELARDEKLRGRLRDALAHGDEARRRALPATGLTAAIARVATDRELQDHLRQMTAEFKAAQKRIQKKRSHKFRNVVFLLAGGGAVVALFPRLRARFAGGGTMPMPGGPSTIEEQIEVGVPVSTAYNQWTQFEDFPLFMEGVDHVQQLDDTRLRWVASIGGKRAEWEAKIVEQQPDTRIVWESTDGRETRGTVTFDKLGEDRTQVRLSMTYRPQGPVETVGSAVGIDRRRVKGDLERFRELIESRGTESGAWRGEVEQGATT